MEFADKKNYLILKEKIRQQCLKWMKKHLEWYIMINHGYCNTSDFTAKVSTRH